MDQKMSLVASFDDLMRCAAVLNAGCETEFRSFVLNQEENRQRWLAAQQKADEMESKIKQLEAQTSTLDTQVKHARNQVKHELSKRNQAEQGRIELEQQLEVIRQLLTDRNSKSRLHDLDRERLHSLYNNYANSTSNVAPKSPAGGRISTIMESSASMLSDISYDKTEDDLDISRLRSGRKWKRPSAPPVENLDEVNGNTPPKKHKEDLDNSIVTTTTITVDGQGKPVSATTEVTVPKMNKSFSEPNLDHFAKDKEEGADSDSEVWVPQNNINTNNNRVGSVKGILKKTPETPSLRKASSAGRGLNRVHIFISRTVIKPTICVPCGKNIRFSKVAMKCKDCKATCHPECKEKLPLPCIASAGTPSSSKLIEGILADFAPVERPMIPRLVVNCASEIERRGLSEVGIYRISGSDRDARELKEKFLKGKCPNLSNISDIHSVCGCLKDFLRNLKEPLVTLALWPQFVRAAENNSLQMSRDIMLEAISSLPTANRDTLAFLMQHLHRVADSVGTRMPCSNLAKVFGPTLVGYSCPQPQPMQMLNETRKQAMVMEKLFELPTDFWGQILDVDDANLRPDTPDTCGQKTLQSRLGPVMTPASYEKCKSPRWMDQAPNTPRFGNKRAEPRKGTHFFTSPFTS